MSDDREAIRQRAIALLARREHSEKELIGKLSSYGMDADQVVQVIAELQDEGLQSDLRFAEAYTQSRIDKGYGPVRISLELKQKGVADPLLEDIMAGHEDQWPERLARVRQKKFGNTVPSDYKEQAKQSRFLQYRGFGPDQIKGIFKDQDQ